MEELSVGELLRKSIFHRETAKSLEDKANEQIISLATVEVVPELVGRPLWVKQTLISADSLGPEYNRAITGHELFPKARSLAQMTASCKCGDPIRSDQRAEGPYIYYGASGPIDFHNQFNFEGEYLIVAQDGTIGRACVAKGKFWANNHVWIVKLKPEYDTHAVARYLDGFYPYWNGMKTGSVVPKVTSENLLKVLVPDSISFKSDDYPDI